MILLIKRVALFLSIAALSCNSEIKPSKKKTFEEDLAFINTYATPIVLTKGNAKIMVIPEYEARVLTSTTNGDKGYSNGYLNYKKIQENKIEQGGNAYGGEDRLWLAPLGSKYTLFYGQKKIEDENWYVPKAFDSELYTLKTKTKSSVHFYKKTTVTNNIGSQFKINIDRSIFIYSKKEIESELNLKIHKDLHYVGFGSINKITNIGENWSEKNGIITPWILGMFNGCQESTSIFPYKESNTTPLQLSTYLNPLNKDRLIKKKYALLYKTDGAYRSKIGIKPENTIPIIGNYNSKSKILTVITFSFNKDGKFLSSDDRDKKNELWKGDVVNSYNNGLNTEGAPSFFELESASEAKILKKNESIVHRHKTFHFSGDEKALNDLCIKLFHYNLKECSF
ncbi:DUF6786 family protein [uncultured Maribacter sp.]|uniref:DUF6786 family protein n=1 Tax=uncultured Maribacter sp. TaxID=431308 RepID=UPI00260F72F0|nr:DUF6786 family protein [uncultured Maribacter sp.]